MSHTPRLRMNFICVSLAKAPDGALVDALRTQTEAVRVQDREFGAGLLLEQMHGHLRSLSPGRYATQ